MTYHPRIPELLALEGWYGPFKLSCRFNDILRASNSKHFISCFRKGGTHEKQREKRCVNPHWAVIYVPDRSGNFIGRAFVCWKDNILEVSKIYGNKLDFKIIKAHMSNINIQCRYAANDTYL